MSGNVERLLDYAHFIDAASAATGLDRGMIAALILTENAPCDPLARRVENDFYYRYIHGKPSWVGAPFYSYPEIIAASFGLVQIMFTTAGEVARKHNVRWDGKPWSLFEPGLNIRLGASKLKDCIAKHGEREGVAAYNSGTPRRNDAGELVNERYVKRFESYLGRRLNASEDHGG